MKNIFISKTRTVKLALRPEEVEVAVEDFSYVWRAQTTQILPAEFGHRPAVHVRETTRLELGKIVLLGRPVQPSTYVLPTPQVRVDGVKSVRTHLFLSPVGLFVRAFLKGSLTCTGYTHIHTRVTEDTGGSGLPLDRLAN